MVQSIDKERVMETIKHEKSVVDFFTGAGTGLTGIPSWKEKACYL